MKETFAQWGIEVIALSSDSVEAADIHKKRDHVELTLLADPQLHVIRLYGVEHHKALGLETSRFSLFGMPLSWKPSFKTMAIPTSLLIDEQGQIVWIDQSDDYRLRSDEATIVQAIEKAWS